MNVESISVVIATYNRAKTLEETLRHFLRCKQPGGIGTQLVVVDNNSTDDTRVVVQSLVQPQSLEIEYAFEGRQGVSYARNSGIRRSRGDVISIIDDDMIPHVEFFNQLKTEFERVSTPGVIGGRIELWDQSHLPVALQTGKFERVMSKTDHPSGFIAGGNMSLHRDVLRKIGGFDERFGAGRSLGGGAEDCDFFYRALRSGCDVRYSPNIVTYHNHGRTAEPEIVKLFAGYHISNGAFFAKHILRGDGDMLRMLYWELLGSLPHRRPSGLTALQRRIRRRKLWYYVIGAGRYLRIARQPELSPPE
jgi:GT2 family glycosyltransferase